jgi:hypothetical protein
LEENGMVEDYTIVPDFKQMGFEIMSLTFVKMRPDILLPEVMEQGREYSMKWPNAIFASSGEGLGMTGVIISFHKNYTEYHQRLNLLRVDWKDFTEDVQSFVISIGEEKIKKFSLTHLKNIPF